MKSVSDLLYKSILGLISVWKMFTWIFIQFNSRIIKIKFTKAMKKMGITVNGKSPHDIKVLDERLYNRVCQDGTIGFCEAYMDGYWTCERIDLMFFKLARGNVYQRISFPWDRFTHWLKFNLFNLQTTTKAHEVVEKHYDLGNDLFKSFLDPSMTYSCGYWRNATNLKDAQLHKMELIGQKLKLKPGMRVLDIGCGFGALCEFLARKYNVHVVGINISVEGVKLAKERCKGLSVDIRLEDYRALDEKFDRIVSVGMFEHVGQHNYDMFFKVAHRCLDDGGIFLLHTIGMDNESLPRIESFTHTYIFPNGSLPYLSDIVKHTNTRFTLEDLHNFGNDYSKTLLAWHKNFVQNWPSVKHLFGLDSEKIFRIWTIYFLAAVGGFSARKFELWQVVLTKNGLIGGYDSVR